MRTLTIALLSCLIGSLAALDVGETAPSLDQATWVKGAAPDLSQQITVVEFWATWCGPCLQSIPHLTELQHQYGDQLAIAGLSDEPVATIEPFVTEQGEQMDYRVGSLTGEAREAWMAGIGGIPHAFIVDKDGTVLWQGHPMSIDRPLAQALAGTLDPEQAKRVGELEQALQQSFQSRDLDQIRQAAEALLAEEPTHEQGLYVLRAVSQQQGDPASYRSHIEGLAVADLDADRLAGLADMLLTTPELEYRLLDKAVDFARRAKEAAPEDADVLASWAHARYLLGDVEGAIQSAEQATQLDAKHAVAAARLAYYRQAQDLATGAGSTAAAP